MCSFEPIATRVDVTPWYMMVCRDMKMLNEILPFVETIKRFRAGVEIDFRQISEECYGAVEKKLKS
jgi:hypothetical protein